MRKIPLNETRTKKIGMNLTQSEFDRLKENAKRMRLSIPDYIMRLNDDKKIVVIEESEDIARAIAVLCSALGKMSTQVNKIGVNINQAVALCNQYRMIDKEDVDRLTGNLQKVTGIMSDVQTCCYDIIDSFEKMNLLIGKKKNRRR